MLLIGRRSFDPGAGTRNMMDEDGEHSNGPSREQQDSTDVKRNKAEDTKINILSNIQSMMPGES